MTIHDIVRNIVRSRTFQARPGNVNYARSQEDLRDLLFQSMIGAGALAGELYVVRK